MTAQSRPSPGQQEAIGEVDLRREFVHYLRNAHSDPESAQTAMDSMSKYLKYAKTQLEQTGKTQLILDNDIISNYVICEDTVLRFGPFSCVLASPLLLISLTRIVQY